MRDSERSSTGTMLRNAAAKLISAQMKINDVFGARSAEGRAQLGLRDARNRGRESQSRMRGPAEFIGPPDMMGPHKPSGPEMIGPRLPQGWRANPFANFKTMGFGAGGLTSGGLTSGGLDGKAYGRIARGDAARRKAEAAKTKDPQEKTNDLLGTLVSVTKKAWQ